MLFITRNITEQKLAQEAVRRSEVQLRALLNATTDAAFLMSKDGTLLTVNSAFAESVNMRVEELIGINAFERMGNQLRDIRMKHFDAVVRSGEPERWIDQSPTRWWDNSIYPITSTSGAVEAFALYARDITEQRRVDETLRESEKQYRAISETIFNYAFAYDIFPDGDIEPVWITDLSFERMTGYKWGEIGASFELYHPDDVALAREHVAETIAGNPTSGEYRIVTKSGEIRWLHIHRQVEWDEAEERPIRLYGAAQDITERKRAEEDIFRLNVELQNHASHLATLNEIARGISAVTDLESTLKQVLVSLQGSLPLDAFFIGLVDSEQGTISYPIMYDSGKYWKQESEELRDSSWIAQVLKTGQPLLIDNVPTSTENTHYGGRLGDVGRLSLSVLMVPLTIGSTRIGVISVQTYSVNSYNEKHLNLLAAAGYQIAIAVENARLYDSLQDELTVRKRLEAELQAHAENLEMLVDERTNALRRAKEQLEIVLNSTQNALAFADPSGDIRVANPAYRAVFSEKGTQSIEFILWSMSSEEQVALVSEALLKTMYDREEQRVEAQIVSEEGHERDVDLTLTPVSMSEDEKRMGVLLSGHDITQMKEIERFKARFVADAVHDLATPIAGLSTRLYLLKRSPEKLIQHINALENQVHHLRNLLEDLRTLSRMDRGQIELQLELCDITALLQRVYDTYEPVAVNKRQSLTLHVDPALPRVNIDQKQIERVMVNLVSNAVNYTEDAKEIRIETEVVDHELVVDVIDQGMGISAKDLPYIFDRFYRTATARKSVTTGTGLGLAITKEIVEMHGGTVGVVSEPGLGSTFTVRLPLPT